MFPDNHFGLSTICQTLVLVETQRTGQVGKKLHYCESEQILYCISGETSRLLAQTLTVLYSDFVGSLMKSGTISKSCWYHVVITSLLTSCYPTSKSILYIYISFFLNYGLSFITTFMGSKLVFLGLNYGRMFTPHHVSHVTCHMSHVICHMILKKALFS